MTITELIANRRTKPDNPTIYGYHITYGPNRALMDISKDAVFQKQMIGRQEVSREPLYGALDLEPGTIL